MDDESTYHNDYDSVSKTMLSCFHSSPCEFDRYYVSKVERPPQPKAAVVGSICHAVLLEGKSLDDVACVYPIECLKSNGTINRSRRKDGSSAAGDFEASLDEWQYPVRESVREQCAALLNGIKGHQVLRLIEMADGREEPIYWDDPLTELRCRCRPDFFCRTDDGVVCYDLKFTTQIKPHEFWRIARNFRYWMQDAHYSRGLSVANGGCPVRFVFWAIEDTAPYRVARYEYTQDSRENAAQETAATLQRLAECYETNEWLDDWTSGTNDLLFSCSESTNMELDWSGLEDEPLVEEKPF